MRAFVKRSAAPDDIALEEVKIPLINDDELLVRVKAIGVGIHDSYFLPNEIEYPYPIGVEASGIVEGTGSLVTRYKKGDRIAFVSMMQPKGGTWAEFAAVQQDSLILPIPDTMDFAEAAAVPVAGNTVLRALTALHLKEGDSVFIAGASGAIGTFAIQFAKARGWKVAGSASPKNHEYMESLGADKAVDYRDPNWMKEVREWMPNGVDAAIAIQPGTGTESMHVVKDAGTVITISGDRIVPERSITAAFVPHKADVRNEVQQLIQEIAAGTYQLVIEQTYPFEQGLEALQKTQTRHARGKLVLTLE
ncbi:NADP-dependent oxidoreductase [Sporosarcina gallistercoris]|uniref:NADP-dependent oxidoreductase n=1 Tax=Sporosarcina gallistercoris TaxID=2762245 RepID=A0ABR8PM49_9BACL|nr:NADP-dependent oxidoreductase [Sporosarcina gallistercoris]MBD7909257.1 NADP-dependent oxidoreductase [Sporosarcina gallistercoris]